MSLFEELGTLFEGRDRKLFLVGGSVRDMVLGREPKDLDFTTDALPDEIERLLNQWADVVWPIGKKFGTIAAKRGDDVVEITTFRYDGPGRKPEVTFTDSLEEDLQRRDFTINAMAMAVDHLGLHSHAVDLVDPFGGLAALTNNILDTPRPPEQSFGDDPLRMLRAARFRSQLGLRPSARVKTAMHSLRSRLNDISNERIAAEMDKLLMGEHAELGLSTLFHTGLMVFIVPEADELPDGCLLRGEDVTSRWASLLSRIDPDEVEARLKALKFSTERQRDVATLVGLKKRFSGLVWTDPELRRLIADSGPQLRRLQVLLNDGELNLAVAKMLATEGVPMPLLNGKQVMGLLNIKPGPKVGEAMKWLWGLRMEMGPMTDNEAAMALLDWDKVTT